MKPLFLGLLLSCLFQSSRAQLVGEWRNIYVRIAVHHQSDPVNVMEADVSNWEERLEIKPIRTHFNADGSYYSEYLNLKDSLVNRPTGAWTVKGDSLVMNQRTPYAATYRYRLAVVGDIAVFNGNIDFNADGNNDDVYYGIQKRVSAF